MNPQTPEDRRISQEFFNRLDRNHDRKITLEEYLQDVKENPRGERVISEEEARQTFNDWDMNGDGVIDEKEFWTVMML
ncbi:hypothetical protein FS837_012072 [Tulasnella sp. UAMH 9824]|nr:hypothetical protein FS837_012072 [Tulasnella sp. UAMH 9824]